MENSNFIRNVYLMLLLQIFISFSILAAIRYYYPENRLERYWFVYFILSLLIIIALPFPSRFRWFLNILFCVVLGIILYISTKYQPAVDIQISFLSTVMIFLFFTIISVVISKNNVDLENWGKYLLGALIGLIVFGLINLFVQNQRARSVYVAIGLILFSLFVVYDTNRLLLKKDRDVLSASIAFYLDFINIFSLMNNN